MFFDHYKLIINYTFARKSTKQNQRLEGVVEKYSVTLLFVSGPPPITIGEYDAKFHHRG